MTIVWILLVDCVRIAEFDHGFVCVFAFLVAKKMQEKKTKFLIFNFMGNHVLGEEHEEQSIIFYGRTCTKILHVLPEKIMKIKFILYYTYFFF